MFKKIVFFIYRYPISTSMPIINTAKILAENGFLVDIISERKVFEKPTFTNCRIKIYYSNPKLKIPRIAPGFKNIIREFWEGKLLPSPKIKPLKTEVEDYFNFCDLFVKENKTDYTIGFDKEGSVTAYLTNKKYQIPYCIYSLEINSPNPKMADYENHLNPLEKKAVKKADFVIIQDKERRKIYNKNHHLDKSRFILVPVGDVGPANSARTNFLRKRFKIPPDKKIVLHLGSITEWSCTTELAASVKSWPKNTILVFHGVIKTQKYLDEVKHLQKKFKNKIYISLNFLPVEKLNDLISSADIGIAFYKTTDKSLKVNIREVGLASGKIASYLKNSLPVITFNTKSLSAIIEKEQAGICINKVSQIPKAIAKIINKYPFYQKNARKCFYKYCDYSVSFQKVIKKINHKINAKR